MDGTIPKSPYHDDAVVRAVAATGGHREFVGGLWDDLGPAQAEFLIAQGLKPEHRLLDIGCGALRGGVHFVRYLAAGGYFGIDRNAALIEAGYTEELARAGLTERLPRSNLRVVDDFDAADFGVPFDMGLAFSVFTHLPFNDVRVCLERWTEVAAPGSALFATIFAIPEGAPSWRSVEQQSGVVSHPTRDPYHYRLDDMAYLGRALDLDVSQAANFAHPRGQKMIVFRRA